jgi:hypothetical protein
MSLSFAIPSQALPSVDGELVASEWDGAEFHRIELNNGVEVNFSIIYTQEFAYYLAVIDHSRDIDEILLEVDSELEPHDYFGIEFDNNNDEAIMGTENSPDDTIIVNYYENIAADMYMHSFTAFFDQENNGIDNVEGKAGTDGERLIFEIKKPLKTTDDKGYDINLSQGDEYQVMIAFWNDEPAHSAALGINKRVDNNQFYSLIVGQAQPQVFLEIVSALILILAMAAGLWISNRGLDTIIQR